MTTEFADWKSLEPPKSDRLEGQYVTLERLDVERHFPALWQAFESTQIDHWRYLLYGPFSNAQAYRQWLEQAAGSSDPFYYSIIVDGLALGLVSYMRIDAGNGVLEIGHVNFSPALQRTRAATEALMLMIEHAFTLGYRRIEWKCDNLNLPSRRAAERLGFVYEGLFHQHLIVRGHNRDTRWYALLDRHWSDLHEAYASWLAPANFDEAGQQRLSLHKLLPQ